TAAHRRILSLVPAARSVRRILDLGVPDAGALSGRLPPASLGGRQRAVPPRRSVRPGAGRIRRPPARGASHAARRREPPRPARPAGGQVANFDPLHPRDETTRRCGSVVDERNGGAGGGGAHLTAPPSR